MVFPSYLPSIFISRIPADLTALFDQFIKGKTIAKGVLAAAIIAAIILVTVVFVVILQDAVRKIPVQYSKKIQGRKQVGGQSTYIPLKVNTARRNPGYLCTVPDAVPGCHCNDCKKEQRRRRWKQNIKRIITVKLV